MVLDVLAETHFCFIAKSLGVLEESKFLLLADVLNYIFTVPIVRIKAGVVIQLAIVIRQIDGNYHNEEHKEDAPANTEPKPILHSREIKSGQKLEYLRVFLPNHPA